MNLVMVKDLIILAIILYIGVLLLLYTGDKNLGKMEEDCNTLMALPTESILKVIIYLDFKDILRCSEVNKRLNDISSSDIIWKALCAKYWDVNNSTGDTTFKSVFKSFFQNYGMYINCYKVIRNSWDLIENYMEANYESVYESLQEGLSEKELDEIEKHLKHKLPKDLRLSYRIHNGQKTRGCSSGLFGSLHVYHYYTSYTLLDLKYAANFSDKSQNYNTVLGRLPLLECFASHTRRYIALSEKGGFTPGQIVFPVNDYYTAKDWTTNKLPRYDTFIIANSFTELLANFACQIKSNTFSESKNSQLLLLKKPDCIMRTNSIEVSVASTFYPEVSFVHPPEFTHVYQITLNMDADAPVSDTCQLETRHWIITDETGHEERVDGPGVVGEYPIMKPGETYSWTSCCIFNTAYGNMTGHFVMRNLKTGKKFNLKCPLFHMEILPYQNNEYVTDLA